MKALICDDHEISRDGIFAMLKKTDANTLIDVACNGNEALQKVRSTDYDLVMLDIELPDMSGMEVLRSIKEVKPATKVVMISVNLLKQFVSRALELKASGYMSKDINFFDFTAGIKKVMNGDVFLSSTIASVMFSQTDKNDFDLLFNTLSKSEKKVYPYLIEGKTNKEIADILKKDAGSISTDVYRIRKKMNCRSLAELIKFHLKHNSGNP